jgi:excisionase family DNA binding protein
MAHTPPTVTPVTLYEALPELLTVPEYAAYCRVSLWSVYDQARRGLLPVVRHGRLLRISKVAVNSPVK